mgnify:CR=1 FL=1
MKEAADAVIVGAGHNGLACGITLAKQGWDVLILEKANQPGGACKSAELTEPGFIHDLYATNINLFLNSPVYEEYGDELHEEGFDLVGTDHPYASVFPDGDGLAVHTDPEQTRSSFAQFSGEDAESWSELVEALFANVPSGLGGGGIHEGTVDDVEAILERGLEWALEESYAVPDDLEHCEDQGRRPEADASVISQKAKDRGKNQVGSLGSGNHFLEVQRVAEVFREEVAADFGLAEDQIVVLIHCGSRGLGHQVCTDFLRDIEQTHAGLLNQLPDKELAAAPAGSQLADEYYRAMCAAINFAWVNRQLITHRTRQVFEKVFDRDWEAMEMDLLYDVAHNIAKKEVHTVSEASETPRGAGEAGGGEERELFVHRKGATRAFPAGREEVPPAYRDVGQPIIIPGSMGTGSYVLRGGEHSLDETFGSTAHGAGRLMSRTQAKQKFWGEDVMDDLRDRQKVYVKAQSGATVAEEAPGVYKDVDEVVRVSDALGIGDTVAKTFPVCNIKG